jgi:hypothetical protein
VGAQLVFQDGCQGVGPPKFNSNVGVVSRIICWDHFGSKSRGGSARRRSVSHKEKLARTQASRTTSGAPSLLVGDQHSLVQARLINRLTDSAESIESLLATPALVEEAPNRLFDQFVAAPLVAAGGLLLDLFCQICRQRYVHGRLLSSFYGFAAPLRDAQFFEQVFIDCGAVAWPVEIDLAPDVMYSQIVGKRPKLQQTITAEIVGWAIPAGYQPPPPKPGSSQLEIVAAHPLAPQDRTRGVLLSFKPRGRRNRLPHLRIINGLV